MKALTTSHLAVGYPDKGKDAVLLSDLALTLQAGKLVCFMGPNGIGKSTLLRTLAGLQQPLRGNISRVDAKQVAVVLTDRISALHMTVEELVAFGRYPYLNWSAELGPHDKQILEEVTEQVHISHLKGKKLYELSDGQLQLVMIARALAQETPVMVLDEPTAHLDLNNRLEVMNLLRKLTRTTNKAILVATHELDLALQTADEIWLATRDQKVICGLPEDLVLNGSFDEVFQFKGFDLRTGEIQHEISRSTTINLIGTGPRFLWTKNALERNGYQVHQTGTTIQIEDQVWVWDHQRFPTLAMLLERLAG